MKNPKTVCSALFYTNLENPTHMNYLKEQATLKYLKLVKKYLSSFDKLNAAVKKMAHIKDKNSHTLDIVFADQHGLFDQEGNIKNSDEYPDNIHTREYGDGTIYTSIAQSDGSVQDFKIDWNHSNHLKLTGTDKQHPISDREFIIMTSILEMAENEVIKPYHNILNHLKIGHSYTPYEGRTIEITQEKKQDLSMKAEKFYLSVKNVFTEAVDLSELRLVTPLDNKISEQLESTLSQKIETAKQQLSNTSKPLFLASDPGSHGTMERTVSSSSSSQYDYLLKILLIGDANTYKNQLLLRFSDSSFSRTFITTIGIDFQVKTVRRHKKQFKLQIWDTAGQERFRTIRTDYYRGAMAILLTYSVTCKRSFENLRHWHRNIQNHASESVDIIIVGVAQNSHDNNEENKVIKLSQAQAFAKKIGAAGCYECCTETGAGVDEPFYAAVDAIYHRLILPGIPEILEERDLSEPPAESELEFRERMKKELEPAPAPSNCTLS